MEGFEAGLSPQTEGKCGVCGMCGGADLFLTRNCLHDSLLDFNPDQWPQSLLPPPKHIIIDHRNMAHLALPSSRERGNGRGLQILSCIQFDMSQRHQPGSITSLEIAGGGTVLCRDCLGHVSCLTLAPAPLFKIIFNI